MNTLFFLFVSRSTCVLLTSIDCPTTTMALTVILAAIGVLKILNNFSQKMLSFSLPVIIKNTGPCWCGSVWMPSHAPKVRQFYSLLEYIPRLWVDPWSGWCRKQQINVCLSPSPFLSLLKSIEKWNI